MNARPWRVLLSASILALASGAARCADEPAAKKATPVAFVFPVAREVSDHADFAGRLEPTSSVLLKARVTGYIELAPFREGSRVKKGELLFEIDPRPYKAEMVKAQAGVRLALVRLRKAESDYKRAAALAARKAASEDLEKLSADREEAQVQLTIARAGLDLAALNVSFTRVLAPFDGRMGRRRLGVGGLARADETTLATLTSEGPMNASFDVDERTYLALRVSTGKEWKPLRVALGLANETDFPRQAEVSFQDPSVDPLRGTSRMWATLPNADGTLVPGLSVRVRLSTGKPYKALLVPARSVQAGRTVAGGGPGAARESVSRKATVLVVNANDEVEEREVVLGPRQGDLLAVREGLKESDRVILDRRMRVSPGSKVDPKRATGEKE